VKQLTPVGAAGAVPGAEPGPEAGAIDLARECLYRFLAAAVMDPHTEGWLLVRDADSQRLARAAADLLRQEAEARRGVLGLGELSPEELTLDPLLTELRKPIDELRGEYARVFGLLVPRECPPYETEYHPSSETFFRAQQLADIAGFYRAFGIEPASAIPERPDHISLELEFMAFLLLKQRLALTGPEQSLEGADRAAICTAAQQRFLRDHLAWWVPAFARGLRRKAGDGLYAAVGDVLAAFLPVERDRFDVPAPRMPLQPALIERPEEQAGCAECPLPL
jgi:TorA maturation chaperone TorD